VVGFGGRLLRDEPTAKYINTPDTPLFKKKSLLFGLHRARAAIRENKVCGAANMLSICRNICINIYI
jgi:DNA primase